VARTGGARHAPDDGALLALFLEIASGDDVAIERLLNTSRDLASRPIRVGATRRDPATYFLAGIRHHVYAGDTALHVAAAAYRRRLSESLVVRGAGVRAGNRRGSEPLHYAADGSPGAESWDPVAQRDVVAYLIGAGADPNAANNGGVAPLHRAVRTRCSAAVGALLEGGANPMMMNGSGSTPLHLAIQPTGRSDAGSEASRDEQRLIIALLLEHGASPTDANGNGKTVMAAASSDWIRDLLGTT
jgi:ankyrin repeat protein